MPNNKTLAIIPKNTLPTRPTRRKRCVVPTGPSARVARSRPGLPAVADADGARRGAEVAAAGAAGGGAAFAGRLGGGLRLAGDEVLEGVWEERGGVGVEGVVEEEEEGEGCEEVGEVEVVHGWSFESRGGCEELWRGGVMRWTVGRYETGRETQLARTEEERRLCMGRRC